MKKTAYAFLTLPLGILVSFSTVQALPKYPFTRRQENLNEAMGVLPPQRLRPPANASFAFPPAMFLGYTYDMTSVMPLDAAAVSMDHKIYFHRRERRCNFSRY